ncbi:response regulator [Spirosoma soli]|uniref:Response regulator n=1 Tax=Spirosoma soli TaxID=1770529 RepID=A0ABW5LXT7_9BACT
MQKLLIVDDHRLFAEGVKFLIEHTTNYEVAGIVYTGQAVIPFLARHEIDVLLLDINLPDISGFELLKPIRHLYPRTRILVLSMLHDAHSIERMMEAGASGYCIKSAGQDDLFSAIETVGNGGIYLPSAYFKLRKEPKVSEDRLLTDRETEVIQFISQGRTTNQIASTLFLSKRTVETHRKNIYRKLGIHTNVELTLYAKSHHLI